MCYPEGKPLHELRKEEQEKERLRARAQRQQHRTPPPQTPLSSSPQVPRLRRLDASLRSGLPLSDTQDRRHQSYQSDSESSAEDEVERSPDYLLYGATTDDARRVFDFLNAFATELLQQVQRESGIGSTLELSTFEYKIRKLVIRKETNTGCLDVSADDHGPFWELTPFNGNVSPLLIPDPWVLVRIVNHFHESRHAIEDPFELYVQQEPMTYQTFTHESCTRVTPGRSDLQRSISWEIRGATNWLPRMIFSINRSVLIGGHGLEATGFAGSLPFGPRSRQEILNRRSRNGVNSGRRTVSPRVGNSFGEFEETRRRSTTPSEESESEVEEPTRGALASAANLGIASTLYDPAISRYSGGRPGLAERRGVSLHGAFSTAGMMPGSLPSSRVDITGSPRHLAPRSFASASAPVIERAYNPHFLEYGASETDSTSRDNIFQNTRFLRAQSPSPSSSPSPSPGASRRPRGPSNANRGRGVDNNQF
ncbi:hypothetical protein T439DRAFT_371138 [Meredithblackwellia eburnea MCA 4105]